MREAGVKKRVDVRRMFLGLQQEMILKLKRTREHVRHTGTVGTATELCWLGMLETYLPKRYQAAKAMVLDSRGECSDQIDIVIFDRQYSPFLLHQEGVTYVPAESVYAVIEVKQQLARTTVLAAGDKAASVRRLHRTSARIPHAGGVYEPRGLFRILGGLVTLDGPAGGGLGKEFPEWLGRLEEEMRVDVGCVLNEAGFEIQYGEIPNPKHDPRAMMRSPRGAEAPLATPPKAAIRNKFETDKRQDPKPEMQNGNVQNGEDVKPVIKASGKEEALIFFFLSLLERLQGLATAPAIMFGEYMKALGGGRG